MQTICTLGENQGQIGFARELAKEGGQGAAGGVLGGWVEETYEENGENYGVF